MSSSTRVTRLQILWARLRGTLWFVPSVMTTFAVLLSAITIVVDDWLIATGRATGMWFVFGVGAEGVRGVLSSIAGGIITVTGVVFSSTIVALQLASTQFTPRVLRTFIGDRANQLVLGVFIGTFTYALLILRFVRSESDRLGAFVPPVSVTVAMLLSLVSVGFLIFFINHIAVSITASAVIDRLTREAVESARHAFPRTIGEPAAMAPPLDDRLPAGEPIAVRTAEKGYLQVVREEDLLALAEFGRIVVRMEARVGEFFNSGDVIASVWPQGTESAGRRARVNGGDNLRRKVRAAFVLGTEPTTFQDVALGISRLVDVAVKALSPGINDPTTAAMCLDGIGEVLIVLGEREPPERVREGEDGRVLLIAQRPTYEELVVLAFAQIRHHGAMHPAIAVRLLRTIGRVASRVPPARRSALAAEASQAARTAEQHIGDAEDRARVRRIAEGVLAATGARPADVSSAAGRGTGR